MELVFTFVGTIIGAGFASGQEIRQYFTDFGAYGAIGILMIAGLFAIVGEKIMLMGYTSRADSYDKLLWYGFRCKFRVVIDYFLCFFLVATASTMFSGSGAFLYEAFGLNTAIGSAIMAIITFLITILGIKRIMKISSIIVPILVFITCFISVSSLSQGEFSEISLIDKNVSVFSALGSAIIYSSYNIVMGLSVLPAIGSKARDKRQIRFISVISGIVIGIFGFIIYFALLLNYDKIQGVEIPIAVLGGSTYKFMYGISFVIAVLTTAVGCSYGVFTRFDKNIWIFVGICLAAYLISLFGFSVLVAKLYYVMGIFGVFLISMLLIGYNKRRNRKDNKNEI